MPFPFPSNGKAYSKNDIPNDKVTAVIVSIPFKRESVFQARSIIAMPVSPRWFPFPSNGKAYSKLENVVFEPWDHFFVSIPFKRESVFQGYNDSVGVFCEIMAFPFPSNGKAYSKPPQLGNPDRTKNLFPFPSNGKAYSKFRTHDGSAIPTQVSIPFKRESVFQGRGANRNKHHACNVSIPFKRESVFQAIEGRIAALEELLGFHSLQTGKRIPSIILPSVFPSNR